MLPSSGVHACVAAGKIGFGDLQVQSRLAQGLILGLHKLKGGIFVLRVQPRSLSSEVVETIESAALSAANETESIFHTFVKSQTYPRRIPEGLPEEWASYREQSTR